MPETNLCLSGKKIKIVSFIDSATQKYISLKVKLKNEITEFELKGFFNRIYSAKLDYGYSNTFVANYSTKNLNACLKNVLNETEVINLEELYHIINRDDVNELSIFELIIEEFANMFEIIECNEYSLDEYNEMVRHFSKNRLFQQQKSNFEKEIKAIQFNSYFFNKQYQKTRKATIEQQFMKRKAMM